MGNCKKDNDMSREKNREIFQDTARLCETHPGLKKSIEVSIDSQELIVEKERFDFADLERYSESVSVIVSKKRTYEAAQSYVRQGLKTAVLNFASSTNPGGGVVNGANAQEESLCRCSTLYFCLKDQQMWDDFYLPHRKYGTPLHNDDCIYTPDVIVFKSDTAEPELLPEASWYRVNVLTCAAPNLRHQPSNSMNPGDGSDPVLISPEALQALHEKRLRRILDIAVKKGNEAVILGAFGCGAFMNDPEVVARASKNVVSDYVRAFRKIEFAVYCRPFDQRNFLTFQRAFGSSLLSQVHEIGK